MSLLRIGLNISRGVGQANEYQWLRQGNYDANLGRNHLFSTVTSFQLIGTTFTKINLVIKNIKFAEISPIPTYISFSASLLIPCTLTYIKKSINFGSHPHIHTFINILEYQILPNVLLIANLVASIGLIVLGNFIFGGSNLIFLVLNLLDEQGWINADFIQENLFFTNAILLCKANYLLTSLNLYNAFSLLDIVTNILAKAGYCKNKGTNIVQTITMQEFESKCSQSSFLRYRLSNYHLLAKPVSSNSIENLEDQFEEYATSLSSYLEQDLSPYHSTLLRIFGQDEKWQADYNNDSVEYLKEGIKGLLVYMKKVTKQQELKNKFLSLVRYMSYLSENERTPLLAQLAQIGHYCPERKYIDINLLYDTYIDTIEKRCLSNKILSILHQERLQILDQFLALLNKIKLFLMTETNRPEGTPDRLFNTIMQLVASLMPSFEDVHFANIIKELLSSHLYIHHTSIDTLTGNRISILEKWVFDIVYKEPIRMAKQIFANQYNSYTVLKRIMHSINNESIISFNEIEEWFITKYKESFREATLDEAITWVHSHVYNIESGLIEPHYLLFFLINQGVLELVEDSLDTRDVAIIKLPPSRRHAI